MRQRRAAGFRLGDGSADAVEQLLDAPLGGATVEGRAARDALRIVESTYEEHGGFRLRTLHTR